MSDDLTVSDGGLLQTPLYNLHKELKARLVPFAGYEMPLSYEGTLAEHRHVRSTNPDEGCGLFDVSHMGQVWLTGQGVVQAIEKLIVGDIEKLPIGMMRYTVLTNDKGGVIDDLMVTKLDDETLFLVVNASRKQDDILHLRKHLPDHVTLEYKPDFALIALQGKTAESVLSDFGVDEASSLKFMQSVQTSAGGFTFRLTRCGYTGEDGFEISIAGDMASNFVKALLSDARVKPVGLGARDTLRLEAGLCLYGHELSEEITPIEADLLWIISKRRRTEGGFRGDNVILSQIADGASVKRVGLKIIGRQPVREGAKIVSGTDPSLQIGTICSGGFSPLLNAPIAMGYVNASFLHNNTAVQIDVRGKWVEAEITPLPFVPHGYKRS